MSKPLWTAAAAAKASGGKAVGDWVVTGLSIDSRSLTAGDLFVPLKDVRDGHDFIDNARGAGAGAVMSERTEEDAPALQVEDTLQALRNMAKAARDRSQARRIAVTGSVGKTSLKEAIAAICVEAGATHKSQKSFNNHWGAPLTLASMPKETAYGVFELGMNHAGELSDLSGVIAPHIAVITKIAPAHLAYFENIDAIAAAKAEVFEGLVAGGTAILNRDDAYFEFLKQAALEEGADIFTFGEHPDADVCISGAELSEDSVEADFIIEGLSHKFKLPQGGAHWIANGACAVATAIAAGISAQNALKALAGFKALDGRGVRVEVKISGKSVLIIDESYNANPESMAAGIKTLSAYQSRKVAVLGDMYELGKDELAMHAALSEDLIIGNIDRVIFVGECMRALRGALPRAMRGEWAKDWVAVKAALEDEVEEGDVILVKGSNATGLSKLVASIIKENKEALHVL